MVGTSVCLSRAEWISLDGGILGAAAAFALATFYQYWRRQHEQRGARKNLTQALEALRRAFRVEPNNLDTKEASRAVVRARAAFGWATAHPEHFSFDAWTDLHEMSEILEIWFDDNARNGGFRNSVYMGQGPKDLLWAIGRRLDYFLDLDLR